MDLCVEKDCAMLWNSGVLYAGEPAFSSTSLMRESPPRVLATRHKLLTTAVACCDDRPEATGASTACDNVSLTSSSSCGIKEEGGGGSGGVVKGRPGKATRVWAAHLGVRVSAQAQVCFKQLADVRQHDGKRRDVAGGAAGAVVGLHKDVHEVGQLRQRAAVGIDAKRHSVLHKNRDTTLVGWRGVTR